MSIRPFKKLLRTPAKNGPVTVKGVYRILREVFGNIHFTGAGVSEGADGQINIRVGGSGEDECDFPFKVTIQTAQNGQPQAVVSNGYIALEGAGRKTPKINSRLISADPPPTLQIFNNAPGQIWLEVRYKPLLGTLTLPGGIPVKHLSGAVWVEDPVIRGGREAPANVVPTVDWDSGESTEGSHNVLIADVEGGKLKSQWAWGPLLLVIRGDMRLEEAMGVPR